MSILHLDPRFPMRLRTFLYSATAATLASCNPIQSCTLIGCYDGLAVEFEQPPVGAYRLEAIVPGDPTQYAIDCASAASCFPIFPDLIAEQVTIRLITQQGTRTQEFRPRYENQYPNGRQCGPSCRQAKVTFPA
jgi:hypothetical protein